MYSKTITIEELCRRLRPIFGKKIDELYLKYTLIDNRETRTQIEQALNALYQKHLSESLLNEQLLLEPPKKEVIKGDYPLGKILYGDKELYTFGLREKDWMRHVCISGMSGSGKTTFAFQILGNFIFKKKPFLVFDWKKSFRPLTMLNDRLRIYTVGNDSIANFKINICKPPKGVDAKEWINLLADIITETFSASFGVHKLIVETMDRAFTDFGVYAGSGNYPTWHQIRDRLEDKASEMTRKSRESEWLESALRVAYALTFGNFGKAICYKGPEEASIEDLYTQEVIMELASLSNTEKKFFTHFVLSYIYKYAKAGNVNTTQEFKYAMLVDEAHNIFLKEKPNFITESISDVIFREIREYGVSLITLDQHVSKLSDVVAGNSATCIAFQQMLPNDIETISRLMQLNDRKEFFTKLPVGAAIVRLVERHHEPFLIKAPLVALKDKSVPDEDLQERMKGLTRNEKRKRLFEESVREEALAKKISKIEHIFKTTGVTPDREAFREHIAFDEERKAEEAREKALEDARVATGAAESAAVFAQKAQEEHQRKVGDGPEGFGLRNHLQQKILEDAKKRLLNGEKLAELQKWFLAAGYNRSDVLHTFNYIRRKGLARKLSGSRIQKQESVSLDLTADEKHFLTVASTHPTLSVSTMYKQAGFSPRKGNELRKSLEDKGLLELEEERTAKGWTKHVRILYTKELQEILTKK